MTGPTPRLPWSDGFVRQGRQSMKVSGTVRVPGDKSISHRALIFSALASGTSRIRGILESADVHSTAAALRGLGVDIPRLSPDLVINGRGFGGFQPPSAPLDCGNSGTTARLMAGVAAALPVTTRFVGDASLSGRPMRRVAEPLEAMGARIEFDDPRGTLPMTVRGAKLRSVTWTTETASAQTKSAILLAALVSRVDATVTEPGMSRDHTERMLEARGVTLERFSDDRGHGVRLHPVDALPASDVIVPGDPSSAAFFAAASVLSDAGELTLPDVMMNPTRAGFAGVLRHMGASIDEDVAGDTGSGERVATLRIRGGPLRGTSIGAGQVPAMIDELPLLACVASQASGETLITGAAELRVKESDRIRTVVENLQALGVQAEELPDGMRIVGRRGPLRGLVRTHGDHRIAMAFGVLAALDGSEIEIDDRDCVAVSFPAFWDELRRVTK